MKKFVLICHFVNEKAVDKAPALKNATVFFSVLNA